MSTENKQLRDGLVVLFIVQDAGCLSLWDGSRDNYVRVNQTRIHGFEMVFDNDKALHWTIEKKEDDADYGHCYAFKNNSNGLYLGSDDSGYLIANATEARSWEKFFIREEDPEAYELMVNWEGVEHLVCTDGNYLFLRKVGNDGNNVVTVAFDSRTHKKKRGTP